MNDFTMPAMLVRTFPKLQKKFFFKVKFITKS